MPAQPRSASTTLQHQGSSPGHPRSHGSLIERIFSQATGGVKKRPALCRVLQTPEHVIVSAMEEPLVAADQPDWDLKQVSVPVLVINAKSPFWTAD